jgi:hypothetical protein
MADASLSGYAIGKEQLNMKDVMYIASFNDRWRFRGSNPEVNARMSALGLSLSNGHRLDPFYDIESVVPSAVDPGHDPYEANPLFEEVSDDLLLPARWRLQYVAPFMLLEHIGALECRAAVSGIKHIPFCAIFQITSLTLGG